MMKKKRLTNKTLLFRLQRCQAEVRAIERYFNEKLNNLERKIPGFQEMLYHHNAMITALERQNKDLRVYCDGLFKRQDQLRDGQYQISQNDVILHKRIMEVMQKETVASYDDTAI